MALGCSIGDFSVLLATQGARVTGVDLDGERFKQAQRIADAYNLSIQFYVQDVMSVQNLGGTFDLIVALDILEHVEEDQRLIQSLHGLLNADGTLLVVTPSVFRRYIPGHEERVGHVRLGYKVENYAVYEDIFKIESFRYFDPFDLMYHFYKTNSLITEALLFPLFFPICLLCSPLFKKGSYLLVRLRKINHGLPSVSSQR